MNTKPLWTLCLLFAGCTFSEGSAASPEPEPETRPATEPLQAPTAPAQPVPEVIPRDNCLGCGMGFVPATGKLFLDAYSAQKS